MVTGSSAGALGGSLGAAARARAYGRRAASRPARCPGGRSAPASAGRACPEGANITQAMLEEHGHTAG
eukprot:1105856-Alexandrium_andersonii.AAC.1